MLAVLRRRTVQVSCPQELEEAEPPFTDLLLVTGWCPQQRQDVQRAFHCVHLPKHGRQLPHQVVRLDRSRTVGVEIRPGWPTTVLTCVRRLRLMVSVALIQVASRENNVADVQAAILRSLSASRHRPAGQCCSAAAVG